MAIKLIIFSCLMNLITFPVFGSENTQPPQNGLHKTYYENKILRSEQKYKDGKLHGISKFYFEDGKKALQTKYGDGKIDGQEKTYYPNGKLRRIAVFKNGVMHGKLKIYDQQGDLTDEFNVIDGKKQGIATTYRPDKTISGNCEYKNDSLETCTYFDKQGGLRAKSMRDPENPQRTVYLTYDSTGKVVKAEQSLEK